MNKTLQTITNSLPEGVVYKLSRAGLAVKKHSPEILLGVGIGSIVVGTVSACKATLKIDEVLDNVSENKEKIIKYADKNGFTDEYTEKDYNKDLLTLRVQAVVNIGKLYLPSVTSLTFGIGCLLGSYNILNERNIALMGAYKLMQDSYEEYRKRVTVEYGKDKDTEFFNGYYVEQATETKTLKNGKEKEIKTEKISRDPNFPSIYARFFDESCSQWSRDASYNLTFLNCQQRQANAMLNARGHVFLNEVYDLLGMERSKEGALVGWVLGEGDGFIDFGIYDENTLTGRNKAFVNGYEPSILLDFNVSGIIYDLI